VTPWRTLIDLVKISRPGFWLTALWFYLLPFAQRDMFESMGFWLGAIYVCFPLGLLIYGWNDLTDTQTDALNPRKDSWLFGARPDAEMIQRLPALILLVRGRICRDCGTQDAFLVQFGFIDQRDS